MSADWELLSPDEFRLQQAKVAASKKERLLEVRLIRVPDTGFPTRTRAPPSPLCACRYRLGTLRYGDGAKARPSFSTALSN